GCTAFIPWRPSVIVEVVEERRATVEALILGMAAGEFRAEQIPGHFDELVSIERARAWSRPVLRERFSELRILQERDIGRNLERPRAQQLAHLLRNLAVVVGCPVKRRIKEAAVDVQ